MSLRRTCLAMEGELATIVSLLEDEDAEVRDAAAWALKNRLSRETIGLLLGASIDRVAEIGAEIAPRLDRDARATLATALLARITDAERVVDALAVIADAALLEAALTSDDGIRRIAAASALAASRETALDLTSLLRARSDPLPRVRSAIARTLGRVKAVSDVRVMLDDPALEVRLAAAEAIGRFEVDSRAVEVALAGITESDPALRAAAARALALFARDRGPIDLIAPLLELLFDEAYEVHVACAEGLGALGPVVAERAAEPVLRSVILRRPGGAFLISIHAILALSELAPMALLSRTLLEHDDPRFRAAAATALGEIGREDTIADLRRALDDREWLVGLRAAAAIVSAGDVELGVARLLHDAQHERAQVRLQAAFVLGRMPDFHAELFARLHELASDPDAEVRFQAVESLARWGELAMPAVETVRARLEDPHARVRRQALRSLEDILLVRQRRRLVMIQQ